MPGKFLSRNEFLNDPALNVLLFLKQFGIFIGIIFLFFKLYKNFQKQNRLSFQTLLIVGFVSLYVIFNAKQWKNDKVIVSDVVNYYEFLPAAFVFNDLSFQFINNLPNDFNGTIWLLEPNPKTSFRVPKANIGLSFMYLPFFLMGHLVAHIQGYSTYGYSEPYSMFLCVGVWFYIMIALLFLRKTLLCYFNDVVTSFTLISIALATNLYYYMTIDVGMTHGYSFFLITIFIWLTLKWHNHKRLITAILLGLTMGLITLIRPTNILITIIFILYNVTDFESFKGKIKLFWLYKKQLILIGCFAVIVWIPQFVYWKYLSGDWIFYSFIKE